MDPRKLREAAAAAAPSNILRWQPGTSLPFSNSLASICRNQPTSSKVNIGKKNHHASSSKLTSLG